MEIYILNLNQIAFRIMYDVVDRMMTSREKSSELELLIIKKGEYS